MRLNENQARRADLLEEVEESTKTRIQVLELAAISETLVRIERNTNFLFKEEKALQHNYEELRESLEFTQSKIEEMIMSNSALQDKKK